MKILFPPGPGDLGQISAQRAAAPGWSTTSLASSAMSRSAILLGMTAVLAEYFGLPLDVRHVTLSTATLTQAMVTLGWQVVANAEFWLAVAGILVVGLCNVGVAFSCALTLALRAREVPARVRPLVFRAVLQRFAASPHAFLFPQQPASAPAGSAPQADGKRDDTPQSGTHQRIGRKYRYQIQASADEACSALLS